MYAGSSRLGCFLETLASFRKAPQSVQQELDQISDIPGLYPDYSLSGIVPGSWLHERKLGSAKLTTQQFANIYSSIWLAHLRTEFEPAGIIQPGDEFDLSLLMSQRRTLTQQMARHVYDLGYDGIYYQSRHGSDLKNWAIFEPFGLADEQQSDLDANDPDFIEALACFDLKLDPLR